MRLAGMRKHLSIISICILLVLLSACAKQKPRVASYPDARKSRLAIRVEKEIARLKGVTHTLKGLAWVELRSERGGWQTEAAIVVSRPDMLRIDVMDSLADVWVQMGSDGKNMWLFIPGKRKLYKGRATSRNIRRLASLDSKPDDLISAMAGTPPLPDDPNLVQIGRSSENHLVDLESGLHIWVEKKGKRRTLRCLRYSDGGDQVDYEMIFSDFRRVDGADYPFRMDASFPKGKAVLSLEYEDVSIGGDVSTIIFSPPSRRSGKTVKLSDK